MSEKRNIFFPYENLIREKIANIKSAEQNPVIDPDQEYYDPSELEDKVYLSLLNYLAGNSLPAIMKDLQEIGEDPFFHQFVEESSINWEDVEHKLLQKHHKDALELAVFLAYIFTVSMQGSLYIKPPIKTQLNLN